MVRPTPSDPARGEVLLVVALVAAATLAAGALVFGAGLATVARGTAQAAADGAALAAAHRLAAAVHGTDAAVWDCAGVREAPLRDAARTVAEAGGASLEQLVRDGCAVEVRTRAAPGPVAATGARIVAVARAEVRPGARPGSGPRRAVAVPGAPLARGTLLEAMVAEADRIDRLALPYVWGGGHQSSPAPPDGPFDCSGAVSRLLQAVGYPIPTLVSRDFMRIGRPGEGRVTVWAYDGHVFLTIDGRGWGTGSRPNGGAGWLPYHRPYHRRFVARHLPELEDDTVVDLAGLHLGSVLVGAPGGPPQVVLVPVEGRRGRPG
jgi:cell wall-associated NlpC family hydrolase